ncbi:MAG TPA: hypothetical protein VGV64_04530 [Thermoplasmata archaeon]|nr:hypothetical protein [Thermoplasmata archaeon]
MPRGLPECPACGRPVDGAPRSPGRTRDPSSPAARAASAEVARQIARLAQWREAGEPLGVVVPAIPPWVESRARKEAEGPWLDLLHDVERTGQEKVVAALIAWEERTRGRLDRLEAYAIDSRLEREQIEEAVAAGRSGEVGRALASSQQVDRVISLKERHLDQARSDLEQAVNLLRDMRSLGIPTPHDPAEVSEDLELELRRGRLAPLKQQLRSLRLEITRTLKLSFPAYVSRYGDLLTRERSQGASVDREISELAFGARAYAKGRTDEAVRRLRVLSEAHGPAPPAPAAGRRPSGSLKG